MAVGEWDQRQLCSDGSCIGVIGADGTCKVCGRAAQNWGDERNRGLQADAEPDEDEDDDDGADGGDGPAWDDSSSFHGREDKDDDDDEAADDDSVEPAPAGWTGRELCPDGSCIGVIGPDGVCKVCGKRGTKRASKAAGSAGTSTSGAASSGSAASAGVVASASTPDALGSAAATPAGSASGGVLGDNADDWGERKLCSDPTCVGVSGLDGKCKVCGKECA